MLTKTRYDVVIIGAGAAGLFCAGVAGQRGLSVLVVDHASKIGEKIRISGGGRCNFTNRHTGPEHFLSLSPDYVRPALKAYRSRDFIALVREHGIVFEEKHKGQLFCKDTSQAIVKLLIDECQLGAVQIRYPVTVKSVVAEAGSWHLQIEGMDSVYASQVVVATGGLPVPAIGASAWGLDFARSLGIGVTEVRPGLVPLSFTGDQTAFFATLAGLSAPIRVAAGRVGQAYGHAVFDEDLLFTHKGLSGPAILQASSYWQQGESIDLNWLWSALSEESGDAQSVEELFDERLVGRLNLAQILAQSLPERLARILADELEPIGRKWAELKGKDRQLIVARLKNFQVKPAGHLGWNKAEVMLGGVDTAGLDPRTMASKVHSNLFFIGECVDVTGHLGGHNFQWAWASGYACAQSLRSAESRPGS
jgi:predicted Rossmann fold flavoprotein